MVISNASLMREGRYIASEHNTVLFINLLLRMYPHYEANNPETGRSVFTRNSAASRGRQQPRRPARHTNDNG